MVFPLLSTNPNPNPWTKRIPKPRITTRLASEMIPDRAATPAGFSASEKHNLQSLVFENYRKYHL